jgi:hypothetical protein
MRQIFAPEVHGIPGGSPEAVAATIDTGLDLTHPDLAANYDPTHSVDCTSGAAAPLPPGNDVNGHGTHTAGTMAADDKGVGTVGVAPNVKIAGIPRRGSRPATTTATSSRRPSSARLCSPAPRTSTLRTTATSRPLPLQLRQQCGSVHRAAPGTGPRPRQAGGELLLPARDLAGLAARRGGRGARGQPLRGPPEPAEWQDAADPGRAARPADRRRDRVPGRRDVLRAVPAAGPGRRSPGRLGGRASGMPAGAPAATPGTATARWTRSTRSPTTRRTTRNRHRRPRPSG